MFRLGYLVFTARNCCLACVITQFPFIKLSLELEFGFNVYALGRSLF